MPVVRYKPSGSIEYVRPHPTLALPHGCGAASPLEADGGAAAPDQSDPQLVASCAAQQAVREKLNGGPVPLQYRLKAGREGKDGYYEHFR